MLHWRIMKQASAFQFQHCKLNLRKWSMSKDWSHHSPSMSLQFYCSPTAVLTVLEVALGQRVDFIGLGAFQRHQLIRKEDRWDVEVFPGMGGLCSPHHGGPLWDCSHGQVLWVDYSVHKQWMKVVNSGQPWFATAQHVLAGIAGKSLKGILHQYLACWQMQHQSKQKTRQIEKSPHGFSQKAMTVNTTATWNTEIWTPRKCWDTSTPPGHTKSTADPFDGSVIIDPHG